MSSLRKGTIRIGTLESLHGQVVVGDILSFRGRCCQTDPNVYLELPGNGPFNRKRMGPFPCAFAARGLPATIAGEFRW